jgi:hypothetical protein
MRAEFIRKRAGWLAGVVLTVVGSFYLAGTVWAELDGAWRSTLVLVFLAVYAAGFTAVGRLMSRRADAQGAGRWMLGLAAALAPIHAMAAGGLWDACGPWSIPLTLAALAAVGSLHLLLLRVSLPALVPAAARPLLPLYLAIALGVGLLPVVGGPAWLLVPGAGFVIGLWLCMTRCRALPGAAIALLALASGLHVVLSPPAPATEYAPLLALAALAVLYVDVALARWRGVHRLRFRGLRGTIALALAGLALALVVPDFQPLPRTWSSGLAGLLLVPFFLLAALAWRRPALWFGGLVGALLFTLSIPDLARIVTDPMLRLAGHALGYGSAPLPLAWYSLTLLPYILACVLTRRGLERTPWRQRIQLAGVTHRWAMVLSAVLVVLAHTRLDDLRPALITIPIYGVLWLRHRPVRALLGGALPTLLLAAWCVDLVLWLGAVPSWLPVLLLGLAVIAWFAGFHRRALEMQPLILLACVWPGTPAQLGVLAVATVLSVAHTVRDGRPRGWLVSGAWAAVLYLMARLTGPLQGISPGEELTILVLLAVILEVGGLLLADRGRFFTRPLRIAAAGLPFAALAIAMTDGSLGAAGLAAAGAPFIIRYTLRARPADLVVGLVLLDVSALVEALRLGLAQPLAYAGPLALSLLVAAQLLRGSLDSRVVTVVRYTAAATVYATTMAEAFGDPVWSLALLVLSLLGLAAGALLRVRAFLYLGSGFAAAALACELLRFGLAHSHFWALYLTVLGLTILAFMVASTLWRQPLVLLRERFVRVVGDWE